MNPELDYLPPRPRRLDHGIGCIGAGFIMRDCHLVAYHNAGFRVVAIATYPAGRARAEDVARLRQVPRVYDSVERLLEDPEVEIADVAVPPHAMLDVIRRVTAAPRRVKGVLAQKPLGMSYAEAREIVERCAQAGITLAVNQNMRYDQSVRALHCLLARGDLGEPVLATIEMRAIPHWKPWQKQYGWLTLRVMSIHHLDCFRFWFGDPARIYASVRPDPRSRFPHSDGICLYILEYDNGLRCSAWDDVWTGPAREGAESDIYINWRVEGIDGLACGTIGWPSYPEPVPSTLRFTSKRPPGCWLEPRWNKVWFPDAFEGTMAQLLIAVENQAEPEISGRDNLKTMALVEAAYRSAAERRAVSISEILEGG
ncbi:MAG: Gfo/Idh/MocA family oxidoreductase [Acidobacteria bacterium]|nr:Gfo/Idh/MocA family oxidoreductase [Acidobacteriota bacterium]